MFCSNCGSEIQNGSAFCGTCGKAITTDNLKTEATAGKYNKRRLVFSAVVLAIAVLLVYVITRPNVDLKYEWGTHYNTVSENEKITKRIYPGEKVYGQTMWYKDYVLKCMDNPENVDGLEGISESNNIEYHFYGKNVGLYCIQYAHSMPRELEQRLEIMTDFYGNDYYIDGSSREEFSDIYWWIDDTVVRVSTGYVIYISEEHFLEEMRSYAVYEDLKAFFDK